MNKITFCLSDKAESFSFDFDYFTLLDDGSITYYNITKHTGFSSNEFYDIENIFKQNERFDLIVLRCFRIRSNNEWELFTMNRVIHGDITSFESSGLSKVNLTIKPKFIWDLDLDDEFYKHLPAIRREIKLNNIIGI